MANDDLPTIRCEQPMAEFDGEFRTSRHTTEDGCFLVALAGSLFSEICRPH